MSDINNDNLPHQNDPYLYGEEPQMKVTTLETPHPFAQLKTLLQSDPEYAWSYHCNLAVPIMDVTGVSHYHANSAAALIMMQMFEVDTTKHEHYQYKKSPVQEYYELRVESEREEDEKSSEEI